MRARVRATPTTKALRGVAWQDRPWCAPQSAVTRALLGISSVQVRRVLMPILMAWRRLCRALWPFSVVCLATLLIVLLSRQGALTGLTGSHPITARLLKRGNWCCLLYSGWWMICTRVSIVHSLLLIAPPLLAYPSHWSGMCIHGMALFVPNETTDS